MTTLTRWEPFREFSTMQDRMNRMNRLFRESYSPEGLALPAAVIACCGCIVGMSKRWRPESLRRESRCRTVRCHRLWTFSGTVRTNGRTGSTACKLLYLLLQRNGSRVRSIMKSEFL